MRLHDAAQVVCAHPGLEQGPATGEVLEPTRQDGLEQSLFRAEVILHGGLVAHAGRCADLSERHAVDAVQGEQAFRGQNQLLLGRLAKRSGRGPGHENSQAP